jgi:hypothetical protein
MRIRGEQSPRHLFEYDTLRRRLWIFGQRCHHGATGSFVAAAGALGMIVERDSRSPLAALVATGTVLMAHDWKDRSMWFERGHGTQP